ncbi:MAG: hypothetical protein ACLF0P_15165 [Thermoanaerobaculia bacterium]
MIRPAAAPALALALAGLAVAPAAARAGSSAPGDAALVIREGSVARRQVVALGRDVVVAGEALSDVAALDGSVRVTGSVEGDVIVLGGGVLLAPSARVTGDVFALGGTVDTAAGAVVGGRTVAHPTASAAWLTLLEGPALGLGGSSPLVVGAKLALMAAWMALTLLLFAASGRELLATSDAVRHQPFRCFAAGLTGVLALVLTVVAVGALAPPVAGAPLLVLLVLFALLLKLWGMVAVFHALGAAALGAVRRPRPLVLNAATAGLLLLGIAKFVPLAGSWIWTVATLIGVGASFTSKFGRQEAWFRMAELDAPAPRRA